MASHFWVKINLYLKAELLESKEQVKEPSPSVIPDSQPSCKVGNKQVSEGVIVLRFRKESTGEAGRFFFISLS